MPVFTSFISFWLLILVFLRCHALYFCSSRRKESSHKNCRDGRITKRIITLLCKASGPEFTSQHRCQLGLYILASQTSQNSELLIQRRLSLKKQGEEQYRCDVNLDPLHEHTNTHKNMHKYRQYAQYTYVWMSKDVFDILLSNFLS